MDQTKSVNNLEIQNQIRSQMDEAHNALVELHKWEQEMKVKSPVEAQPEDLSPDPTDEKTPPLRNKMIDELKKSANEEKEKGNAAIKANRIQEALEHYTKAIEIYDADLAFYSNRALCYLKLNQFDECIADCNRTIELDYTKNSPVAQKAIFRRMKAYESIEKFPQALIDCQTLIKLDKKKEESYKKTYADIKTKYERKLRRLSDYEKIEFVTKPPNLRSKQPLKRVDIIETRDETKKGSDAGTKTSDSPIDTEIPDEVVDKIFDNATGEASSQSSTFARSSYSIFDNFKPSSSKEDRKIDSKQTARKLSAESESEKIKLKNELNASKNMTTTATIDSRIEVEDEKDVDESKIPEVPRTGSQFHSLWRELSNYRKYLFLKKILSSTPSTYLSRILDSTLDSELLTEILFVLKEYFVRYNVPVQSVLIQLGRCTEMSILSLLMSGSDREALNGLIIYMQMNKVENNELELIRSQFSVN